MIKKSLVYILIILLILISCGCLNNNSEEKYKGDDGNNYIDENLIGNGTIEDEEYEVYSAVLQKMDYINSNPKLFVIEELTSNREPLDDFLIEYFKNETGVELNTTLIEDYQQKNVMIYRLQNNFSITNEVILISYQELYEIFDKGGWWDEFYERYPDSTGTIELSRVGFNENRTQAVLYFGNTAGGLAGAGYIILLHKSLNEWIIDEQVMTWIS